MEKILKCETLFDIGDSFYVVNSLTRDLDVRKYVVIGMSVEFQIGKLSCLGINNSTEEVSSKYLRYYVCDDHGFTSYLYDSDLRTQKILRTDKEVEEYVISQILSKFKTTNE